MPKPHLQQGLHLQSTWTGVGGYDSDALLCCFPLDTRLGGDIFIGACQPAEKVQHLSSVTNDCQQLHRCFVLMGDGESN